MAQEKNTNRIKGRGATGNPKNRFKELEYDFDTGDNERPATKFYRDASSSIITYNESPDVGFDASINPYRGCEHGCAYCYARPTHEYLGFSAGLDFETRIMVKENAPELLRNELASKSYTPQVLAMSGVTDPYQPIERHIELTRRCLQVLAKCRNPVALITKNHLITRDVDVLLELASYQAAKVHLSISTLDNSLRSFLEPRTSHTDKRLEAIRTLNDSGIPVGVLVAPVIPGLTDHEIPQILQEAASAGAKFAGYIVLRLPFNLKKQFEEWLETNIPNRKEKVLNRIRQMRDGDLNETEFGTRMKGNGKFADQIADLFRLGIQKSKLNQESFPLSTKEFIRPSINGQIHLFHQDAE
ncbi:MAG: PA0069 family radical SAM protein [Candidatus Marinimicrobia bacterium]|nr:PA0069 family radical SAM protein [Candidatus Neomarinimicrobiota bacterium]MCF7828218.1 PA0069 family radical SAM protein [Candidatus Neomarinimicrobiota bacterium]MCF7879607.1 PA0069 family radical SAM protein [Candidatus Neomarinimicrobiota bacterium]